MSIKKFVMALDAGTSSSRAIVFDHERRIAAVAQREFRQIYPQPGWVEHDPVEIWETQLAVAREAMAKAGATASSLAAIGITNQRETTVVWDRETGRPVYNAIVWQCRRTSGFCDELRKRGLADSIRATTGLVPDAYFSGTKLRWILENVPGARAAAEAGRLLFGTIDSWLLWNLTGGRVHATDYSNASRTMMYDIGALKWSDDILGELNVPRSVLPEVRPSSGVFGETAPGILDAPVPVAGVAGDQQSALFGQTCFSPGDAKNTYGTGCFMLMNTGERRVPSENGLLTTIAWGLGGKVDYALEGRACWRRPATPRPWPAPSRTRTAASWCPRSPDSAHRTGTSTRAAPSSASRAASTATTSSARRSNPSPTRRRTCWRRCRRTPESGSPPCAWTAAPPRTTS